MDDKTNNKQLFYATTKDGSTNIIELLDSDGTKVFEFRSDGTFRAFANGTAYKDMIADLYGKRLTSPGVGTVSYDDDENCIVFEPSGVITNANDRVGCNQEINHEMKVGNSITFYIHLHWWQLVTSGAVAANNFTVRYRVQRNDQAKTTAWTSITATAGTTDDVYDFTGQADGLYNQITNFDPITINCGISDTIQFQMTRTDAIAGDVSVYFIDIHGEVDSLGSNEIVSKT